MDDPTLDKVRAAKDEILRLLRHHDDFAGAGIGRAGDRLVVHVNWRALPTDVTLPERIGPIGVTHHVVGNIRALSAKPPTEP
jgi:hypothetical protein